MAAFSRIFSVWDFFVRKNASDAFSCLSEITVNNAEIQNKKSNLTLEQNSILHFDGFNLNAIIKNRHIFNLRFCSSFFTYLSL